MDTNILIVAACLVLEAGGEGKTGMEAVREVIGTRASERRLSEAAVCLQRRQFSCFNGVPWLAAVERSARHPRWNEAVTLAGRPAATRHTHWANHYFAPAGMKGGAPSWAAGRKPTAIVGGHRFYRL